VTEDVVLAVVGESERNEVSVVSRERLVDIETLRGTHVVTSPAIIHDLERESLDEQGPLSIEIEWFTANAIAKIIKKSRDAWVLPRLERYQDSAIEKIATNGKPAIHYPFWALNILIEEALIAESYPDADDYYSLASLSHAVKRGEPWLLEHLPLIGVEGEMRLFGKRPAMAFPPETVDALLALPEDGKRRQRLKYSDAGDVLNYFREKFPGETITQKMVDTQLEIDTSTPSRKYIYDFFGSIKGLNEALLKPVIVPTDAESQGSKVIDLAWIKYGLCAQTDPEAFFPDNSRVGRNAKKVCQGCEVKEKCLKYALDTNQRFGVWGGLSEGQLKKLRRERKAEVAQAVG
jgi:WhiB family redox-sensing transcriptional regulator